MKKIFIGIIIGGIWFGSIGVGAATLYNANKVSYKENNVESALNELYSKVNTYSEDLLWTNSSPTERFYSQTISLDLSEYDEVKIASWASVNEDESSLIVVPMNTTKYIGAYYDSFPTTRTASRSVTGVTFGDATAGTALCIPVRIYGIKKH